MKINSINNTYNYNNQSQNKQTQSFKGNGAYEFFSKGYEKVASSKPFQGFIKNFSKSDKTFTYLLVAESFILSGFYMINTLRNKKIKKEQKPQMLINDTLTLGVSTAGALFAEDKITNVVAKGAEKYFKNNADFYQKLGQKAQEAAAVSPKNELLNKVGEIAGKTGSELTKGIDDVASMLGDHLKGIVGQEGKLKTFQITPDALKSTVDSVKTAITGNAGNAQGAKEAVENTVKDMYNSAAARAEADKTFSGINKLKVLVIFGLIYRYLGPVVITPIANKLSSKLFNKNKEENEKKA